MNPRQHFIRKLALLGLLVGTAAPLTAVGAEASLPAYVPQPVPVPKKAEYIQADGSIQVVASSGMYNLVDRLNKLFAQSHPQFKFKLVRANNTATSQALTYDQSAFAAQSTTSFGNAISAYTTLMQTIPFGVKIGHSSLKKGSLVSPLGVIVHKSNPMTTVTTAQIARVFSMGGRKTDLTHWNQLGVKDAAWAGARILPCGLPDTNYYASEDSDFSEFMFITKLGGDQPAYGYKRLAKYSEVVDVVASDPMAMCLTSLAAVDQRVKVLAISGDPWSKPTVGTREDLMANTYPYDRPLYIFVRRAGGAPVEPFLHEYLRMVYSREGQAIVADEADGFVPLGTADIAAELARIN